MLKKAMITAAVGAAVVGGGTAALAASGSTATSAPTSSTATPSTSSAVAAKAKHAGKNAGKHKGQRTRLGRSLHATWVTKGGKTHAFVTHDAIHGTVAAVSATSVTVKAADGVSQTYTVTSSTKVRKRATTATPTKTKAAASSIAQVKTGDKAVVIGTGTTSLTATHIVDGLKK